MLIYKNFKPCLPIRIKPNNSKAPKIKKIAKWMILSICGILNLSVGGIADGGMLMITKITAPQTIAGKKKATTLSKN